MLRSLSKCFGFSAALKFTSPPIVCYRDKTRSFALVLKYAISSRHPHIEDTLLCYNQRLPNIKSESLMEELLRCRSLEAMCRQRALYDTQRGWEWLANAEKWKDLGDKEVLASEESATVQLK
jgi:hypothetical protein